jgi:hypothetical protein
MSVRVLAAGIHRHKERQPEPDLIANKPSVDVANRLYATVPQDRDHQFETGIRRPIRCIIRHRSSLGTNGGNDERLVP